MGTKPALDPGHNGPHRPDGMAGETSAKPHPKNVRQPSESPKRSPIKMRASQMNFFYRSTQALHDVNLEFESNKITALIGPSGCGKSTFLRTLNRMHEFVRGTRLEGNIELDGKDIFAEDVNALRRRIGMVFQRSNPFPRTIAENVSYGVKVNGIQGAQRIEELVEKSLVKAALWGEVKDKLHQSAFGLSGGQQQRLCIARALAINPEVLLLDEPCSALDPISTAKIEELLLTLKTECTIIIVTHNMQQAARASDYTGFFLAGRLIEFNETRLVFTTPSSAQTEAYITGRFG